VFITAYDQYAVEAFEQGVVDYVLKPAERERLQLTAERIRQRMAPGGARTGAEAVSGPLPAPRPTCSSCCTSSQAAQPGRHRANLQWIQASVGQAIQMIPVAEVLFFISDEKYTRVQTATSRR
jgi:DNA-binding LytR/AlgR family response regulator